MSDALLTLPCDILYHADVVWCDCVNVVCYSVLYGDGTVVVSCECIHIISYRCSTIGFLAFGRINLM